MATWSLCFAVRVGEELAETLGDDFRVGPTPLTTGTQKALAHFVDGQRAQAVAATTRARTRTMMVRHTGMVVPTNPQPRSDWVG